MNGSNVCLRMLIAQSPRCFLRLVHAIDHFLRDESIRLSVIHGPPPDGCRVFSAEIVDYIISQSGRRPPLIQLASAECVRAPWCALRAPGVNVGVSRKLMASSVWLLRLFEVNLKSSLQADGVKLRESLVSCLRRAYAAANAAPLRSGAA